MRKSLLLLLAVILHGCSDEHFKPSPAQPQTTPSTVSREKIPVPPLAAEPSTFPFERPKPIKSLLETKELFLKQATTLKPEVIEKVITTLKCARERNIIHNNILTIIDYSLPASEKRLWVFNLADGNLLFHTYVAHGIKSGTLLSTHFSNQVNSKASSIGVFNTEKPYRGRHGLSLKLYGLDKNFNDNAYRRFIVMHGAWYADENFVKKYGRVGRSWGCPAVPIDLTEPIINTIKDNSLFVVYYPDNDWFSKSKFLNCDYLSPATTVHNLKNLSADKQPVKKRQEGILFADINNNYKREEHEPVIVISAENYRRIFNITPPLTRMIRLRINHMEYIALNHTEFRKLASFNKIDESQSDLNNVSFVVPHVTKQRGYYFTKMIVLKWGKIKEVRPLDANNNQLEGTTLFLEAKPAMHLRSTNQFIRWLGL